MRVVAESLSQPQNIDETLARITHTALSAVPGADFVSISVRRNDESLETRAATSPLVPRMDAIQYDLHEGPCYEAVTSGWAIRSADLASDARWPRFGPQAAAAGLHSQLAIRLADKPSAVIGLNLYARVEGAFDPEDGIAELFASHAAVALGYAEGIGSLAAAIGSRDIIANAVGMIMEREGLDRDEAYAWFVRRSSTTNTKLREIAADFVARNERGRG